MAEDLRANRELVKGIATDLGKADTHAHSINVSFGQMLKAAVGGEIALHGIVPILKNLLATSDSYLPRVAKSAYEAFTSTGREIDLARKRLHNQLTDLEEGNKLETEAGKLKHAQLERLIEIRNAQFSVNKALVEMGGVTKIWLALTAYGITSLRQLSAKFNQDLIEANSALQYRLGLLESTLAVQRATGASFDAITESARALIHYSLDERDTYSENLKLVTMLKDGIGLSVGESAHLAAIWEHQLGQDFHRAADVLVQIVNSTSLAADEAGRLAHNLADAIATLRPGVSGDLGEIVKAIAGYEDQLKRLGGKAGGFQELLTRMTRPEGLTAASLLGVRPEFIGDPRQAEAAMQRFGQFMNQTLAGLDGWSRQVKLGVYANIFGTNATELSRMAQAVQNNTLGIQDNITVEERYRQQIVASGKAWATLGNQLLAILHQAFIPVLRIITPVIAELTKWIGALAEIPGITYMVTGALVVGGIAAYRSIKAVIKALWDLAINSQLTAKIIANSRPPGMPFGPITPGGWLAGQVPGLGLLRTLFLAITNPIVLTLVAAGALTAFLLNRVVTSLEQARRETLQIAKDEHAFQELRKGEFYQAVRHGNAAEAKTLAQLLIDQVITDHPLGSLNERGETVTEWHIAQMRAKIVEQLEDLSRIAVNTQITSRRPYAERLEDKKNEEAAQEVRERLATLSQKQLDAHEEANKNWSKEQVERRQDELLKMGRGSSWPGFLWNSWREDQTNSAHWIK